MRNGYKNHERKAKALVLDDLLTHAANIALDLEWNLERFQDKNAAHFISAESDRFKPGSRTRAR